MQIASITIRYSRKYQIADFDWVHLETTLHASIDEVEASTLDPHAAATELYAQARAIVRQQAREILTQHQAIAQAVQGGQSLPPTVSSLAVAELVPEISRTTRTRQATPEPTADQESHNDDPDPSAKPTPAPAQLAAPTHSLPRTPKEAETRFFDRYGAKIGGTTWADVQRFLDTRESKPHTVTRWFAIAERVRDHPHTTQM